MRSHKATRTDGPIRVNAKGSDPMTQTENTTKAIEDVTDFVMSDPTVEPHAGDMQAELAAYRADGHRDAVLWSFVAYGNRYSGSILWFPALGRAMIEAGGDSEYGDCSTERDMERCIIEYLGDYEAWEARN